MGDSSTPTAPVNWVRIIVMKNVDADGMFFASVAGTLAGFAASSGRLWIRPFESVTVTKVFTTRWMKKRVMTSSSTKFLFGVPASAENCR